MTKATAPKKQQQQTPAPPTSKEAARELLLLANEDAKLETIAVYLDAWWDYHGAQANITEHGPIVLHPRSGAPIGNPYLPIREAARKTMAACDLETDDLWPA